MSGLFKRGSNIPFFKRFFAKKIEKDTKPNGKDNISFTDRFKLGKTGMTVFGVGTVVAVGYMSDILGVIGVVNDLKKCIVHYDEENGNKFTAHITKKIKERERRTMIGDGVGQGLAWLHYVDYLEHVLPGLEDKVMNSEHYQNLSKADKGRMSTKLYELIPRKCYVNIPGTDENIDHVGDITIDDMRNIKVSMYSVTDGTTTYYCVCNCPHVLKTMNNVNDIQMAITARLRYLPWNRNIPVQLFTVDAKLVQLMRFYYALSSLLCLDKNEKGFQEKARLLLFNESDKKPSNVLFRAIEEDLKVDSSAKNPKEIFTKDWEAQAKGNDKPDPKMFLDIEAKEYENNVGAIEEESEWKDVIAVKVVDRSKKKNHSSLMENKLLSAEEIKDDFYDFDVFVAPQIEDEELTVQDSDVGKINEALRDQHMKMLLEAECVGKDWLTKLKYAATKCRWIVFLGTTESSTNRFTSHTVADSVKPILESRKVQTVAIVNEGDEFHIRDDLRWVTCIPYQRTNEQYYFETLHKVVSGLEIKLENSKDLYLKPGEVAIGLAWNYAADYLNKILQVISEQASRREDGKQIQLTKKPKLFIIIPESCQTHSVLKDAKLPTGKSSDNKKKTEDIHLYELFDEDNEPALETEALDSVDLRYKKYCVCEYPRPVEVIYKMGKAKLLTEEQMKSEVKIFYKTVDKIMEILIPEKTDDYEFVYYNDTEKQLLRKVLLERYHNDDLLVKHEQLAWCISSF